MTFASRLFFGGSVLALCLSTALIGCADDATEPTGQTTTQPVPESDVASAPNTEISPTLAIFGAILDDDEPRAIELLEQGADVNGRNDRGVSVLHFASRGTMPELTRRLIESGADINDTTANGDTPLHWAARAGASDRPNAQETVEVLLEAGLDINVENNTGNRPADYAVALNNQAWLAVLQSHGAVPSDNIEPRH